MKFEDRFDHDVQRTYTLTGFGRMTLNAGDRVYWIVRASCETANSGRLAVLGPSSYPPFLAQDLSGSQVGIRKIFTS